MLERITAVSRKHGVYVYHMINVQKKTPEISKIVISPLL